MKNQSFRALSRLYITYKNRAQRPKRKTKAKIAIGEKIVEKEQSLFIQLKRLCCTHLFSHRK